LDNLLAIPVLLVLLMFQMVIGSHLTLLNGAVDLLLLVLVAWALQERVRSAWTWAVVGGLMMSFISALPLLMPLAGYLVVVGVARLLQRRVWQTPVLAMLFTTIVGSLFYHLFSLVTLKISGVPLPWVESISQVLVPSTLLNLILALPVYALVVDLANWVYPAEVEE
jgi:rod shape-determining protein MreD